MPASWITRSDGAEIRVNSGGTERIYDLIGDSQLAIEHSFS